MSKFNKIFKKPSAGVAPEQNKRAVDKSAMMRSTVYIPVEMHREFKSRCTEDGTDMTKVILRLVRAWLDGRIRLDDL